MMLSRIGVVLISSTPPRLHCLVIALYLLLVVFIFMKPLLPASSAIRLSIRTSAVNIFKEKPLCPCLLSHVHLKERRTRGKQMLSTFSSNISSTQTGILQALHIGSCTHINPYATVCCSGCFICCDSSVLLLWT